MAGDSLGSARGRTLAIPPEPDRRWPLFFVSHAIRHSAPRKVGDPAPNDHLTRFFDDLSENVSQLFYRPPGADPGFIDRTMEGGVAWQKELLTNVGTCQVLVALVSDPYTHRDWCAWEWDAFMRRTVWQRGDKTIVENPCLIPVLWAPIRQDRMPGVIRARQIFVPTRSLQAGFDSKYRSEGIFGLLETGHDQIYGAVMWDLAFRVVDCALNYWVAPGIPSSSGELRNEFDEGGTD